MKLNEAQLIAITNACQRHSRYDGEHFNRHYGPNICENLRELWLPDECWIGVTCLPRAAVRQVVTVRDTVAKRGCLAIGCTLSGRMVIADMPEIKPGSNAADVLIVDNAEYINTKTYASDTWVIVVTDKDPNVSAFTGFNPDEFGQARWEIVHQPAKGDAGMVPVLPIDPAVLDDMRK